MTAPLRSLSDSSHHSDSTRKRISKACDRCRLKKSKCNGDSPCSRCSADNAICVFGERKRAHDRVYPKGYVEMLEQQQSQLVSGLQETYRRLQAVNAWPGAALDEREGRPLTHDILSVLDIIHHKTADGQIASMMFEDDPEKLQQRLIAHGAPFLHRRASISSESDHSVTQSSYSQSTHSHKRVKSCVDSPITSPKSSIFRQSFDHQRLSKNKPSDSHTSASNTSVPVRNPHRPSPLHLDLSEINNQQPPPFEEDALMASFSWQDVQPDMISDTSTDMPQFSFPMSNNDYAGMAQWPLFAQPGIAAMGQNGPGFTSLQQLQRDPLDTDFTGFGMPVGVQT